MTERGSPDPHDKKVLDDFLAECILVLEQRGDAAMEELLASRPDLATKARGRLRGLRASGLLAPADPDPESIGPYRIRQRLGSGGMGTVYLALQDGDIERRVAIKVVKRGMDSREVLARFALERQALAMLDHQNIAKVLDAGQTDDGRPFLVMEYVSGLPITTYCDERRLSIRARIELFCLVCEAVQHAHHKGLIHRDLKPSNILVADREGRAWPIVIDFGVAKSLGGSGAQSLMTVRGRVLGTPEYMSPEQAANEMDVDTRTDVFSLGVVLFELLTGTLPIDSSTLRRADSGELSRILRSFDTPAPSRRVTTLVGSTGPAVSRHTDLSQLRRTLRGDLDWITLRALERDRNRRYGMPGELAADLQRHLADEPVLAGPPGALYRWQKFFARNRLQVSAAAFVLAALLVGLGVSVAGYCAAAASARQSEADFGAAVAAIERLVFFGDDGLADEPQMDEVRRHLLQDALAFYERISAGHSDDPRLALRIAEAAARAGRIQYILGDLPAALATLQRARTGYERLQERLPTVEHVAFVDFARGQALGALGRTREAEEALRRALAQFAAVPVDRRQRAHFATTWLAAAGYLAHLVRTRDPVAARADYEAALELAGPWLGAAAERTPSGSAGRGDDPFAVRREGITRALHVAVEHASLLHQVGDMAASLQRAEPLRDRIVDEWEVRTNEERLPLAEAAQHLGALFVALARPEEAAELLELAAGLQRWASATYPARSTGPRRLAIVLHSLAGLRSRTGELDAARTAVTEAVQVLEALVARVPDATNKTLLGKILVTDASIRATTRNLGAEIDTAALEAVAKRAIALLEASVEDVRKARDTRLPLTAAWVLLAGNHKAAGRFDEALAALEHATAETEAMVATEPALPELRRNLVDRRLDLVELAATAAAWQRADELLARYEAEAAATKEAMPMLKLADLEVRVSRVRMRIAAGRGDVERVLAEVRAPGAIERDWNGKQRKAEALVLLVDTLGAADGRRTALLGEARELLTQALAYGETADPGTEAMVAVMCAQTAEILVRVERAAGDAAAAARAAAQVVDGYEPSFRDRPSERNHERFVRAGEAWCAALADSGDAAGLSRAIERLAGVFAGRVADCARLAGWCDRLATMAGADTALRDGAVAKARALRSVAK